MDEQELRVFMDIVIEYFERHAASASSFDGMSAKPAALRKLAALTLANQVLCPSTTLPVLSASRALVKAAYMSQPTANCFGNCYCMWERPMYQTTTSVIWSVKLPTRFPAMHAVISGRIS